MNNNLLSEHLTYNGGSETFTHFHLCSYGFNDFKECSGNKFGDVIPDLSSGCIHWLQVHGLRDTDIIREVCSFFQISFLLNVLLFLVVIIHYNICLNLSFH